MRHPMIVIVDPADGTEIERRWYDGELGEVPYYADVTAMTVERTYLGTSRLWRVVEGDGSLCEWDLGSIDLTMCGREATHVVTSSPEVARRGQVAVCAEHVAPLVDVLADDGVRDVEVTRRRVDALAALLGDGRVEA